MTKNIPLMILTMLLLISFAGQEATAQTTPSSAATTSAPQFEVGALAFGFNSSGIGNGFGVGGRFAYNLTDNVAIDTELSAFMDDEGRQTGPVEGFAGVRAGIRTKHVGIFAKARPGFITNLAKPRSDFQQTFAVDAMNKFAFDVGGVVEYYPTRHLAIRFDVGDTIIPLGDDPILLGGAPSRPGTTHNLQQSLGISFRF
jgi:hypothetical protein